MATKHTRINPDQFQTIVDEWAERGFYGHGKYCYARRCDGCGCYTMEEYLFVHCSNAHKTKSINKCENCGYCEVIE